MRKLFFLISLLVVASMILAACGAPAATEAPAVQETAAPAGPAGAKDTTTFVDASSSATIDTLDPALAYDTASGETLFNIYETLVFYDGEATDKFVPMLAESYSVSEDGKVWTFNIRKGVKFHEGGDLTPSDVEYSFERGLLQGGYSSPQWLLAEPFWGVGVDDVSVLVAEKINAVVDAKADELVGAVDLAAFDAAAYDTLFTDFATAYNATSGFAVDAAAVLADEANVTAKDELIASLATLATDDEKKAAIKESIVGLLGGADGGDPYALADDREAMTKVDPAILKETAEYVMSLITSDDAAGTVTMTLAQAWGPFEATIAQSWGEIMDKEWVLEKGGWDGSPDTWQNTYAMQAADNPFSNIANGTGPFKLEKLANGEEIVLVRNDAYWREPAKIERVVLKQVSEWGTRFAMMQAGDADVTDVPVENRAQMDELVGERCEFNLETNAYNECQVVDDTMPFRLRIGRPGISQDVILFNFDIRNPEGGNPYIGSGALDGNGIPSNFFSDVHIRKAFAYCFDWDTYISDVFNNEAVQSYQLPLPGMPGYSLDTPHYTFDLAKCEEEFKLADLDGDGIAAGDEAEDGGDVWNSGFRVQMSYNQGNTSRQIIAEILAGNLSSINDKFLVEILGLPWPAYLRAQRAKQLPIMTGGWLEDIHDPHNWYQPYLTGTYGARQSIPAELKAQAKEIIDAGVAEVDPAKRAEIYAGLNQLYYEQAIGVPVVLATSHGFSQRWVKGVITNPIFPGNYFYTMYKE